MAAFFISPEGEIIEVETIHIAAVINNPAKFGLSMDTIYAEYRKYGEPIGIEGKARKKILMELINQGWIRIRHYPKDPSKTWRINIDSLTPSIQKTLSGFAYKITAGINGFKEQDLDATVSINQADGAEIKTTIAELQNFAES